MVSATVRLLALGGLLILVGSADLQSVGAANNSFSTAMQAAAQARQVPLPLIEAIAYVDTRWEWIGTPASDGGVGPMNILPSQMDQAAALSGHSRQEITTDFSANIDAGAALLAHAHSGGNDLSSWQAAVISTQGARVADQIYEALRTGATRTTSTGETITLAAQPLPSSLLPAAPVAAAGNVDYPGAVWVPANPANYSPFNRPSDFPVNMIVIHDIEGSVGSAISAFQDPNRAGSAHYIVSYQGQITQMVAEHDVAWHAGNWDYNTRAIGIEHEGFAWTPGLYTTAQYNASAQLAASICSRWGVPMDRQHVIGHNEVPDPFNPGQFGGADHHTDPGPYWDWPYYMSKAQSYANALPSPPHMGPAPIAVNGLTSVTVSWQPAQSCHLPITGYTVVAQPGNIVVNLGPTATSTSFTGLQVGTSYTFDVTATNGDGQDTLTSNPVVPGSCVTATLGVSPSSPRAAGTRLQFTATSAGCANPQYQFWLRDLSLNWTIKQPFGGNTWTWDTSRYPAGTYKVSVWANRGGGQTSTWDTFAQVTFNLLPAPPCASASISPGSVSQAAGSTVNLTASSTGCSSPQYEFFVQYPGGTWYLKQGFGGPAFSWDTTGLAAGVYVVHAWANQTGTGWDAIGSSTVTLTNICAAGSINPSSTSAAAGSIVNVTAGSSGCLSPRYEFWVLDPTGTWSLQRGWGGPSFGWDTTRLAPGTYTVHAWVNQQGSGWDTYGSSTITLTGCTSASVTPPTVSVASGTTVNLTATAGGCSNPTYEFWVQYPDGSWNLKRGFGGPTYAWDTTGLPPGNYTVHVWANQSGAAPTLEAYGSSVVTLTGCTSSSVAPPSGSAAVGTKVTLTATATGCPAPDYEFWLQYPDGTWHLMQPFGNGNTWQWDTTGRSKGTYVIHIWTNTLGADPTTHQTIGSSTFTLV